jgi:hypothetical protein
MPPRTPVISEPGVLMIFSCAWYISSHAGVDALADHRARRDGAVDVEQLDPVVVLDAGALASSSLSQITGPPRFSVSIIRLSLYVLWMPHFWCGVMKLSRISLLPLGLMPRMPARWSSGPPAGGSC